MQIQRFSHFVHSGFDGAFHAASLDGPNTLILVFCAPAYRSQTGVFDELRKLFPTSTIVGCSTAGEIHHDQIHDFSIAAVAIKFEGSRFRTATIPIANSSESDAAGASLANQLAAPDLRGVLIFSDGMVVNGSALIHGFNRAIDPEKVIVSGGLAGDGNRFKSTFTVLNGSLLDGQITAVGFYGKNLAISCASGGGWDKFGPERIITKSAGNVLYEIDGRPALQLYKEYLGERAKDLPSAGLLFPLQIRSTTTDELPLVRTILAVDEATQSLIFAGDMPQDSFAQLMHANFDRVIDGAASAGEIAKNSLTEITDCVNERLSIAVSCVGRRLVLGERAEDEVEALSDALGKNNIIVGYYSYGELAPHIRGKPCELHNQSMTVLTIVELLDTALLNERIT
jgi:hypothetical protein